MNHKLAEKYCWSELSLYVRARDPICFSCETRESDTAGHIIPRLKWGTRYDPRNVCGQCHGCNWMDKFLQGYHDHCVAKFIKKFGHELYLELVELSKKSLQLKTYQLIELGDGFKAKRLALSR